MNNYTAGPWYAGNTGNHQGLICSETTGANIAVSYDAKDAQLIAAAPELLEALEQVTEWMLSRTGPSDGTKEMLQDARRAICKATDC